ncbi:hypothetical protein EJB05_26452, partial [Eragrostis curvula]
SHASPSRVRHSPVAVSPVARPPPSRVPVAVEPLSPRPRLPLSPFPPKHLNTAPPLHLNDDTSTSAEDRMDDYIAALHEASVDLSGDSLGNATQSVAVARKRPMGRDAAKAAKKKAASDSSEYASKMHDLSVQKVELFKETEAERKARLSEMFALEKAKATETREHRLIMVELEKKRLALEEKRLEMKAEKEERLEDERIMAINLDTCQPLERDYYRQR